MMKRLFFLFFLFLMASCTAHALSKDEALNLSKKRIEGLVRYFPTLSYTCHVFDTDCGITDNSQTVTLKWISSESGKFKPVIQFDRGSDKFLIDGAVRIAKTGNFWGAPVVFNEDLLVREKSPGQFEALGFFEIIGVLVHEYGHHQEQQLRLVGLRVLKHEELDELAVKVVSYLRDRSRKIQISRDEIPTLAAAAAIEIIQVDVEWFNGVRNIWSNTFLDSPLGLEEISPLLVRGLQCPNGYEHGHLTFIGKPRYVSMRKARAPKIELRDSTVYLEQEVGEASVFCVDETRSVFDVFRGYTNGKLQMAFQLNGSGYLELLPKSALFRAEMPTRGTSPAMGPRNGL